MTKKHIIKFGYRYYAVDSIDAATKAVALLSKLQPVQHITSDGYEHWHYAAEDQKALPREVSLELNQPYRGPRKEAAQKAAKPLALPKPKRGTIRCICEMSDVAPKTSCTHCGRPFYESHNRTHGTQNKAPKLRLI